VVISGNTDQMSKHAFSFDFILDAVSTEHEINAYIRLLRRDGNMTLVGAPAKRHSVAAFSLIFKRCNLSGSNIGIAVTETQKILDFCGKYNITADIEVIPIQKVNEAYERLSKAESIASLLTWLLSNHSNIALQTIAFQEQLDSNMVTGWKRLAMNNTKLE
jgi:uncharacterized zinc-type alcohol dehydrogenase-like protein